MYFDQVVGPLLNLKITGMNKPRDMLSRVDWFLREDGKIKESERILRYAIEIYIEILGDDHPHTLTTMNNLAETYQAQGKTTEAPGRRPSEYAHDYEQPRFDVPSSGEDDGGG